VIWQESQSRLKAYIRKINLQKTRDNPKLNFKHPEYNISFRWVFYISNVDINVVKAAKMIEEDCPERCSLLL